MSELERCKEALIVARKALVDLCGSDNRVYTEHRSKYAQDKIDAILNPPQEFEEVPVTRWECSHCGDIRIFSPTLDTHYNCCQAESKEFIKLTGTIRRPIPQKVERSVSVEMLIASDWWGTVKQSFMDFPECHGKQGTLTFTWTE